MNRRPPRNRERARVDGTWLRFTLAPLARTRGHLAAAVVICFALTGRAADTPAPPPTLSTADLHFFEAKIRPVLVEKCYGCHSKAADKVRGGLLLDSREALFHGGNSGPVIVAGQPEQSPLVQAIGYRDEDLQMPPPDSAIEKLSDQQVADFAEWVRRGAPDPRTLATKSGGKTYGGVGRAHWAFQPVKKPALPAVQNTAWPQTPVDRFVLATLEANSMAPNPPADKATLIRRICFDLVGLPPSVNEVQAFVRDESPDAYARLVDRLLASPAYGEHWARYWLDVARYSDTKGDPARQDDLRYPHAWTYRDWVIAALNADLPYNDFILHQLAGDRVQAAVEQTAKTKGLPPPNSRVPLAALGFLTLGNTFDGRRDDVIADQIDVTTKAFLGLTVACARCHDHKFDPIPTKDYYSLYGVFANSRQPAELPTLAVAPPQTPELLDYIARADALQKQATELRERFAALRRARDPAQRRELTRENRELQRKIGDLESTHAGVPPRANALFDVPRSIDYPVLLRGEPGNKGDVVPRRFLEILSADPRKRPEWRNGSGRLELARAIVDPKNPLTARVLVNRVWQQHWGAGFVPTPDDLGNMSAPPTHPELLDYLAATFVEEGWSLKKLHRAIVLSAAYRQSSATNPRYAELDPENKLLWRYNLRRLDFEPMHDALLAITGELDRTQGGKPVPISSGEFARRRAIYTLIDRRNPPELLTQFDFPSPDVSSGRRYQTLVPQQALFLMNSPMVIESARKLVDRPAFAEIESDRERVNALYLAVFQRPPTEHEIALAVAYVSSTAPSAASVPRAPAQAERPRPAGNVRPQRGGRFSTQVGGVHETRAPLDAWTKLAHALLQSNEAIFYR